jgi:hypothetical protein
MEEVSHIETKSIRSLKVKRRRKTKKKTTSNVLNYNKQMAEKKREKTMQA